ncbi:hypothetical protein DSO57_1031990 [Entomophthora muscae]|uniref:Uncharacterized protein n=1 Tax=Entomophthora muscae TaxID=34485 RepID=A0ACC2RF60_9FUNG|nr:hypothetical protein DSO57_1031990 [Entomophthora muscae]
MKCQGSSLWGVPENLRADSPQARQGGPTTQLELTLQYKITIFPGGPKVCWQGDVHHPKYLSGSGFIVSNRFLQAVRPQGEERSHWGQIRGQGRSSGLITFPVDSFGLSSSGLSVGWGVVRINNSSSLETWAQEQGLYPKPEFLWAAGPVNCRTAHPRFSGINPPQADIKCIDPCSKNRQTKEIIALNEGLITAPNGDTNLVTISFMNLKSTPATNQEQTQERGTGLRPSFMTLTAEQDNQAAKSRFLTNGRTPRLGAILPPLDPSTQFPWPWPSQCLDGPPMENVKFGGGYYIDPRILRSKLIAIFE